jgi:hypothetical protein
MECKMRKKTAPIADQIEPRKKVKIAESSVISVTSVAENSATKAVLRNYGTNSGAIMSGREKLFLIYQKNMDDLAAGFGKNSGPFVLLSHSLPHQKQL